MDKNFGIYTGIVIDSTGYVDVISKEGIRFIGQVMVKINGITPSLINESFNEVPSDNVKGTMALRTAASTEVLAYIMQPIMGSSTPGIYNSSKNTTAFQRTNTASTFKLMGKEGRGIAGDGPKKEMVPTNNPYCNNYYPNYPWNTGLGSYSIPEVNTCVIIGFLNGARNLPIVLGKLPKQDELESFYIKDCTLANAPNKSQNYNFGKSTSNNNNTNGQTTTNANSVVQGQELASPGGVVKPGQPATSNPASLISDSSTNRLNSIFV